MGKSAKVVIAAIVIIAIIAIAVVILTSSNGEKTKLGTISSAEDLSALIERVYEGESEKIPSSLETRVIDTQDQMSVMGVTGLENADNIEYIVASEPMITSQAYSFVLVKVKDGVNANDIAKEIHEKVDERKWICVSAEKIYATSSGNIVALVMGDEKTAKNIYDKFKALAENVGQEYERQEEEIVLPDEMLSTPEGM